MKIVIPEPKIWYSALDEKRFFMWLSDIPQIYQAKYVSSGIEIKVKGKFKIGTLYDLISIMNRYDLDIRYLRKLCLDTDRKYFERKKTYWYKKMFCDPKAPEWCQRSVI